MRTSSCRRAPVDNALSPTLAAILRQHGHEASHVRDHGLQHDDDETIFAAAARQDAVLVSAATEFGRCSRCAHPRGPQ